MAQTREEFKAANALAEAAQTDENAEVETEETEAPQAEEETPETEAGTEDTKETDEDAESSEDESEEPELENWMKGDGHESQADKKFTGEDIGIAKARLKTKLNKRHEGELEKLQARITELETQPQSNQPSELQKPKREDFDDKDDPDEAFTDALMDWKLEKHQAGQAAATAATEQQRVQQDQATKVSQGEDDHYDRAEKLIEKSNIPAEKYQAADTAFKQSIESVIPTKGDEVSAMLVARLGEGSEKVVYNIGVNKAKQEKLTELLKSDPSGLDAYGYLVELKLELNSSTKRKTNAPKPAPTIKGDVVENASIKALKKQYQAAVKTGNSQQRFDLRRKAKAAGAKDVNDW